VQEELDRSIKLSRTNTMTSTEFTVGSTDRANKVLAFDSSGEISVTQELGTFKGNSATTTTAAFVARDIVKATTTAQLNNIYICVADSVIGDSLTDTDHFALLVDAVSAATSATASATSATASASSATAAASSASTASTQASNASTSASNAASSATAAASSATDAAASADAFDDIYLGSKSSDPSTDNDGDALAAGMLYFNTTNDILRVYSGSAWQDAALSSTGVATLTGTQTLQNKTLTTPKIAEIDSLSSGDITLDAEVDINLDAATDVNIPANVGLTFGDDGEKIEGDGTHLTISGSDHIVVDAAGEITLDSDSNEIYFRDGGTQFLKVQRDSNFDVNFISNQDKNIEFQGNDGGAGVITALKLDIANAGAATFNAGIKIADGGTIGSASDSDAIAIASNGVLTINGAYTLPTADGSANQVLQTNGSGALSFGSISSGGITMAQQWRLTASKGGENSTVSANLEIVDTNGYGSIGSNMTESSGIFTFPSTGIYLILVSAFIGFATQGDAQASLVTSVTTNNSSFGSDAYAVAGSNSGSGNSNFNVFSQFLFDVTNTTTHKVKFFTESFASGTTLQGNSDTNFTSFGFYRLGDT